MAGGILFGAIAERLRPLVDVEGIEPFGSQQWCRIGSDESFWTAVDRPPESQLYLSLPLQNWVKPVVHGCQQITNSG